MKWIRGRLREPAQAALTTPELDIERRMDERKKSRRRIQAATIGVTAMGVALFIYIEFFLNIERLRFGDGVSDPASSTVRDVFFTKTSGFYHLDISDDDSILIVTSVLVLVATLNVAAAASELASSGRESGTVPYNLWSENIRFVVFIATCVSIVVSLSKLFTNAHQFPALFLLNLLTVLLGSIITQRSWAMRELLVEEVFLTERAPRQMSNYFGKKVWQRITKNSPSRWLAYALCVFWCILFAAITASSVASTYVAVSKSLTWYELVLFSFYSFLIAFFMITGSLWLIIQNWKLLARDELVLLWIPRVMLAFIWIGWFVSIGLLSRDLPSEEIVVALQFALIPSLSVVFFYVTAKVLGRSPGKYAVLALLSKLEINSENAKKYLKRLDVNNS